MKSSRLSIGATAARFGLATHVLRHWEDLGLLHPERNSADRRLYGDDDLVRIAVILRSKAAGMITGPSGMPCCRSTWPISTAGWRRCGSPGP
jgi:hypothetical protein